MVYHSVSCDVPRHTILSYGTQGVISLRSPGVIMKSRSPSDPMTALELEKEAAIYEKLGSHPFIPEFLGTVSPIDRGIAILLREQPHGDLHRHIATNGRLSPTHSLRLCLQISTALEYLHAHGIYHADVAARNVLLDSKLNARLCDFAGSACTFLNLPPSVFPDARYSPPSAHAHAPPETSLHQADLFALASCFFHVCTGEEPYADLEPDVAAELFNERVWPEVPTNVPLVISQIIKDGWDLNLGSASEVVLRIRAALPLPP